MIPTLNGVVIVDKPVGPTSFDIVHQARRLTGSRKVGHGGTLDPAASGVLPICFGEGTKIAQFLLDADKEYLATVRFGVATDSYDATGKVTGRQPAPHLTSGAVADALAPFRGWIDQTPPVFSALKRDGKPLYAYARAGEEITVASRRVRLDALVLEDFEAANPDEPTARLRVVCSKGTYIRSLAHDLGAALGVGAHLAALRRTRSGPFGLDQAIAPEALVGADAVLLSPAQALAGLPALTISAERAAAVSDGKAISWQDLGPSPPEGEGPIRLLDEEGRLIAVAIPAGPSERVRTLRVFRREG
ncbi:MAG TPA: tRNA pseudouridine(55) synthase TruB [Polyangia bacterium]|jgi:tRNA pseudouridine55 synthase